MKKPLDFSEEMLCSVSNFAVELRSDHMKFTSLLLSPKCNDFSDSFAHRRPIRVGQNFESQSTACNLITINIFWTSNYERRSSNHCMLFIVYRENFWNCEHWICRMLLWIPWRCYMNNFCIDMGIKMGFRCHRVPNFQKTLLNLHV